ncbi:MAG: hypothetical protein LBU22_10490 [Dysgonamonadaceae bacterium]|jgi:alpha-tubulin suppressor-like RCC1 family protein|nr:hypothetical protein [Dysgonamonadaceae bacterium]
MNFNKIIKYLLLALFLIGSIGVSAQVSIGRKDSVARGVLDVNNPQGHSNTMGIVLPKVENLLDVESVPGEPAVPGTVVYDLNRQGIRLMTAERGWTDVLLDDEGIKKEIFNILAVGADFKVKYASMGPGHSLCIGQDDNAVYVTGDNSNGRTGIGRTEGNMPSFTLIFAQPVVDVSAGSLHSAAVDVSGQLWVWGNNAAYRTGLPDLGADGDVGNTGTPTLVTTDNGITPLFSDNPANSTYSTYGKAIQVEAGWTNTFVLTDKGEVWGVGTGGGTGGSEGSAGVGSSDVTTWTKLTFTELPAGEKIVQISCSGNTAGALSETGKLWTWGEAGANALGVGNTTDRNTPIQVTIPGNDPLYMVAMGFAASAAISADKKHLYTWGNANMHGRGNTAYPSPGEAPLPGDFNPTVDEITYVAAQRYAYGGLEIITSKGVYGTGRNTEAQLGIGNVVTPQTGWVKINMTGIPLGTVFTGVAKGAGSTILVTGENLSSPESSYVAYGMGATNFRQLGAVTTPRIPTQLTK